MLWVMINLFIFIEGNLEGEGYKVNDRILSENPAPKSVANLDCFNSKDSVDLHVDGKLDRFFASCGPEF